MQITFKTLASVLMAFILCQSSGCSNKNTPVEPVSIETTPTGEKPPPGKEPVLPEGGP